VRIAHLADLHLGFRQYARQTPQGINQREADVANACRAALEDVTAAAPDLIVIAGDLFHHVRPTNAAILYAFQQFSRLRLALPDTPIVLIAGNHDTPRSVETGSILKLLGTIPGVHAVTDEPRRVVFPELSASVLAVPHVAWFGDTRPAITPDAEARVNILLMHGDVPGIVTKETPGAEFGGAELDPAVLRRPEWDYVALGHYHVPMQVAESAWYAGALEHVTVNIWGEAGERGGADRPGGKGWLLVEPGRPAKVRFRPVPAARRVLDLPPIHGAGLEAAAIDREIAARVKAVRSGIADQIVRQVVWDVPRPTARELDHTAIRALKAQALHYHLDLRRPETGRPAGIGSPGQRQTVPELVQAYLAVRPLPPGVPRERVQALAAETLAAVERDAAESGT
jgi:hypothetical protein